MKIKNFSVITGTRACNAKCPFCISRMTPENGVTLLEPGVNWRNFRIGAALAKQSDVSTVMLTGKGEPTLYPGQITKYIKEVHELGFPLIELQTNGLLLDQKPCKYHTLLQEWYDSGLTTVALSISHYEPEMNRRIYLPGQQSYIDLPRLIKNLHGFGLAVRLSAVLMDGYIDSADKLERLIQFGKDNQVEQITARPIARPEKSENCEVYEWVEEHHLKDSQFDEIQSYLDTKGKKLLRFTYGGHIYDVNGQNICLTNCLTMDEDPETIRQLVFFPDGHLRYDWQYTGAIII